MKHDPPKSLVKNRRRESEDPKGPNTLPEHEKWKN